MSIPLKSKPCKGTGQAHGYGCGIPTPYRTYGLGKMCGCYSDWLLNSDAGKVKLYKALNKVQKPRLELEKAQTERKTSSSLKNALKSTKDLVHEYVRLRDKGLPCISCGEPWHSDFQACHYHKAELYETLRFNLDNIHGGCIGCNLYKDGNLEQYNINLPFRIGQKRYNDLMKLAQVDKHYSKVWNLENLRMIRLEIKQKIKELNS